MDLRWGILAGYWPLFMEGLWTTVKITVVAIAVGLVLGAVFGLISSSRDAPRSKSVLLDWGMKVLRALTLAYINFFRDTPLFVQILRLHFAFMPALVLPVGGLLLAGEPARALRQEYGAFFSGAVALSLY